MRNSISEWTSFEGRVFNGINNQKLETEQALIKDTEYCEMQTRQIVASNETSERIHTSVDKLNHIC